MRRNARGKSVIGKKALGLAAFLLFSTSGIFPEISYTKSTTDSQVKLVERALGDIASSMPGHPFNAYRNAPEIFVFDVAPRRDMADANTLGTATRVGYVKHLRIFSDIGYYDFLATLAHETFHLCQMDRLGDFTKYAFLDPRDLGFVLMCVEATANLTGELGYILNIPDKERNTSITDYRKAILPHDTFDALYNSYPKHASREGYLRNMKAASLDYLKLFFGNTRYLDTVAKLLYDGTGSETSKYSVSPDKVLPIRLNPRYSEYRSAKEPLKKAILRETIAMLPLSIDTGEFESFYARAWSDYLQGLEDQDRRLGERSIMDTDRRLQANLESWGAKISDRSYQWQFIDQADEDALNAVVLKYYPGTSLTATGSGVPMVVRPNGIPFTYYAGKMR